MGRRAETVKRVRSQPPKKRKKRKKTKISVKMTQTSISSLMCEEVLDSSLLNKTPEQNRDATADWIPWENPLTVKAIQDHSQIKDVRILQNLLRNEDRFLPDCPDYMTNKELNHCITPDMRKIVADWMLEVIQEQNSQPEVFCLAMNIMDRFLSQTPVLRNQLQLLGAVCTLIASKIREPCPIPGKSLIIYTDYSITAEELKEWELFVLYKMQWELSAITPLDYLDHAIPRLDLENHVDIEELRRRTETILVLAATDYQFAYHSPSLMAASAIFTALQSLSSPDATESAKGAFYREIIPRLQAATHTSSDQLQQCTKALDAMLPEYLRGLSDLMVEPDTTTPDSPDLSCDEKLSRDRSLSSTSSEHSTFADSEYTLGGSRSSSPLSAVDIFTEFDQNVLQPMYNQVESNTDNSFNTSILVS